MASGPDRQKDLEARAGIAAALPAVFTALAGATLAGALPKIVSVIAACVALAALIAAFLLRVQARNAGLELAAAEADRARTELEARAPTFDIAEVDPTRTGVDRAAQDILAGGEVPEYVARAIDTHLHEAVDAAVCGTGR